LAESAAAAVPVEADEKPLYQKQVIKRGDKTNFPKKGDTVACYYTGMLVDGE
jgi:FK506-binding protein 3